MLALLVGPVFGQTTPHFPLYIVEAGLVELIALRFAAHKRPIAFGALAALAIGTVGLAAEWGWSHVWWTIPWPSSLFPEGAIAGFIAAVAGGVIGGWIGRSLLSERPPETVPRWAVPVAAVAAVGVLAFMLPMPNPAHPPRAILALTDLHGAPKRTVAATIRLEPRNAARDARWLNITAWQGGSVVDPLKQIGEGVYRTTKPIRVYGNWKVTVRLQKGAAVMGLPVYFPNDPAIPVGAVPARATIDRAFVRDKKNLQREQKTDVPGFLTGLAYVAVLLIWLGMLGALAWGLARLARVGPGAGGPPASSPGAERAQAPAGGRAVTA